jgi:hypothetical protein
MIAFCGQKACVLRVSNTNYTPVAEILDLSCLPISNTLKYMADILVLAHNIK